MINHYINLVVLGNFNPRILTHDFLARECGIKLGKKPLAENNPIPVVSSLDYEKYVFFVDLGRIQITEKKCQNPEKSEIPNYLNIYLNKLKYTPITKCGANFSYDVEVNEAKLNQIEKDISKNRLIFNRVIRETGIILEVVFDIKNENEIIQNWVLKTSKPTDQESTTLKVQRESSSKVKIDFNFEINLEKNRDQIEKITSNYNEVYRAFLSQLQTIFEV